MAQSPDQWSARERVTRSPSLGFGPTGDSVLQLRILAPLLIAVSLLVLPAPALATGGRTITSAPAVVFGQQEFGNTATDGASANPTGVFGGCDNSPNYESLWNLPVTAGDRITIDYEGDLAGMFLFPVGTTDFDVSQASHAESDAGSNQKGEDAFNAAQSGTMPLEFFAGCASTGPGPYDFTAFVKHALVVALSVAHVDRAHHRTTFAVRIHNPDGAPVSDPSLHVSVQNGGRWVRLGAAGSRAFHINWRRALRGKLESVRVQVYGPAYLTTTSRAVRVRAV